MSEAHIVTPVDPKTLNPDNPPARVRGEEQVSKSPYRFYLWFLMVIAVGVLSGFLLSRGKTPGVAGSDSLATGGDMIQTRTEVGSTDTKTFRDTATGKLEIGGSNGEGTHKLIRNGGPTQTVYLISSIIDLDQFAGKQVELWGETLQAKNVGWLMDVGRVKLIE